MSAKTPDLSGLWLSPLVMAARLPIIFYETLNPDPSRRNETNRMVSEKLAAAHEGMLGAHVALTMAATESFAAMAFGRIPKATARSTAQAMVNAGLAPSARRVRANVKRLMKATP